MIPYQKIISSTIKMEEDMIMISGCKCWERYIQSIMWEIR